METKTRYNFLLIQKIMQTKPTLPQYATTILFPLHIIYYITNKHIINVKTSKLTAHPIDNNPPNFMDIINKI